MSEAANNNVRTLTPRRRVDRAELVRDVDRGALRAALEDWSKLIERGEDTLTMLEVRPKTSRVALRRIAYDKSKAECHLPTLTETIARLVESDARQLPNAKREYLLEGFWGDGAAYPEQEHPLSAWWRDPDEEELEGGGLAIIGGGGKKDSLARAFGALAELVAKSHKTSSGDLRAINSTLLTMLQDAQRRIDELEKKCDAATTAKEAALNQAQDRTLKLEQHRELMKGAKEMLGMVKMFGPIIVNKIAKEQVLPVPPWANPLIEQLGQLHEAVTDDEEVMTAILNALSKSPRALALFGDFMSNIQNQKVRELARAEQSIRAEDAAATAEAALESERRRRAMPPGTRLNRLLYGDAAFE